MIKTISALSHASWRCWALLLSVSVLPACAAKPLATEHYRIVQEIKLPSPLSETSGLYCEPDHLLSINDSGNASTIYEVSYDGKIVGERPLNADNQDWEAITHSKGSIFIGEFGNNAGARKDLAILVVDAEYQVRRIGIQYEGNQPKQNFPYSHDFDAEALVAYGDGLIMFSKSWRSSEAHVYAINLESDEQSLKPIKTIRGLPGVITGADWDKAHNRFVVVGYQYQNFGLMQPFIALIDKQLSIQSVHLLLGYRQVEGVCVKNDSIWFSQEGSPIGPPLLVNLELLDESIVVNEDKKGAQ